MRLLRHLLGKSSRSTQDKVRRALGPAAFAPLLLDYDPLVAELANRCR